jgi:putative endonuclease
MLRLKAYRILARNFRTPQGEIDAVAKRGRVLAFVEVRRRHTLDQALNALQARRRRRIARAVEAFLAARPALASLDLRFDVMTVVPGRWPRHIRDAWRLP